MQLSATEELDRSGAPVGRHVDLASKCQLSAAFSMPNLALAAPETVLKPNNHMNIQAKSPAHARKERPPRSG